MLLSESLAASLPASVDAPSIATAGGPVQIVSSTPMEVSSMNFESSKSWLMGSRTLR